MNYLGISGYLTKDAELKHIGNKQTPCVSFSIGHSRTFTNERGNSEKETSFFDITFFGKYAEIKHPRLKKGSLVFIEGILQQDKWVSKEDGKTYTKVQIIGRNINIIEKDKTNQANDEAKEVETIYTPSQKELQTLNTQQEHTNAIPQTSQANDENLTNSNQARNLAQNPNHKTQDMEVVKI